MSADEQEMHDSGCINDIEEHKASNRPRKPKQSTKDPDMFKRLNERPCESHRNSQLSEATIPHF